MRVWIIVYAPPPPDDWEEWTEEHYTSIKGVFLTEQAANFAYKYNLTAQERDFSDIEEHEAYD